MSEVECFASDVSKRELVIAVYPGEVGVKRIANQDAAISAWLDTLPAGSVIGMEATGSYHRRLADLAYERGFLVYVVNPRDVYYYARGMGARGKTDPSDAKLLARYVAHERAHLHPYVPPTALCERLTTLLERRAVLVRTRQALTQSLADLPALAGEKRTLFEAVAALLCGIDRELAALTSSDASTAKLVTRLKTISGVGPLVASLLCALFKRFAFRHADALIAYLGLDPRPDESGQHRGRRRLSKRGYPEWRRLLVAAAMSAARTKAWRDYVNLQRAKALPATAVHVILARKMLRTAFAMFKNGQEFISPSVQPT
ncbi:MAG TPA: IS110 family transposase [Casimicrobiaceae bacterium]|nr:IS110 family transposase [Casimicrobiaceae bacterium]